MKATKKMGFKPIEIEDLDRIGIKFNPDMVKLVAERIKMAEKAGRGLNILIQGDIKRGFGEVVSKQGGEYSYTLYDDGEITILDWDPNKAYMGGHYFWLEGFVKKE